MSPTLRILPEAEDELSEAASLYESKRAGLGADLLSVIDAALEQIVGFPEAYPLWRPDRPDRKCVVSRFPYLIFFTAEPDIVKVIAIAHARRRPGYWLDRGGRTPRD